MNKERVKQLLVRDEGLRLFPYKDTVGKLTIGVGRNLTDTGISESEAFLLLSNDIDRAWEDLTEALPWVEDLDEVRQHVLLNMAFNLGLAGLLKFRNTLALIRRGDYAGAAKGMLASKWASQVGERAKRLAHQMETGDVGVY